MDNFDIAGQKKYREILRRMTPEQKLLKTFELSEMGKNLFICGLKMRYPNLSESDFKKVLFEHLEKCHNKNY